MTTMRKGSSHSLKALAHRPKREAFAILVRLLRQSATLSAVYARVSPDLPPTLVETPVPDAVAGDPHAIAVLYNFDEAHSGRFSVPPAADDGASLALAHVLAQNDPLAYLREHLSFPPGNVADVHAAEDEEADVCIVSPGLNTPHQPTSPRDISAPRRARFYAKVMQCVPLVHLHLGTSLDQADVVVESNILLRPVLKQVRALLGPRNGTGDEDGREEYTESEVPTLDADGNVVFSSRNIDIIQAGLSEYNLIDTPLKQAYRQLFALDRAVTFMVYSRASMEMKAALDKYIHDHEDRDTARGQLRRNITVVTVGAACAGFPDGPAYLHVSSNNDPLVRLRGVRRSNAVGAGSGAVFLHCNTPFAKNAADHHNFAIVAAPLLAIAMAINGVQTMRELWQCGADGGLSLPENVDELVAAMYVISGGEKWLFDREAAFKGLLPEDLFPVHGDAVAVLRKGLGEEFVDNLLRTFHVGNDNGDDDDGS